jgi:ribosomal protein S18 acetylase RimI-like enzyme
MIFREAKTEDLRIIFNWIENQKDCRLWAGTGLRFPFVWEQFLDDLGFGQHETFCLVNESDMVIGLGQLMHRNDRLHLARILVDPERRGKGYGQLLCKTLMEEGLRRHGKKDFSLNVYRHNEIARRLYEKLGFFEAADQTQAATTDSVFMIREITPD